MDNALIDNFNSRVKPGDTAYIIGDFAFADHDPYLSKMNGDLHLVLGNHDHSKSGECCKALEKHLKIS